VRHYSSIIKHHRKGDLPSYLNIGIISGLKVPIDGCHRNQIKSLFAQMREKRKLTITVTLSRTARLKRH